MRVASRIAVLVSLLLFASMIQSAPKVHAQTVSGIDLTKEYANGIIPGPSSSSFWYDWVNYQGTKLIFLAWYSSVYNSPVRTLLGEEFNTTSGAPIFVSNILQFMEIYNDTNHNGILDYPSELKYFFVFNSSQTFTPTSIVKTIVQTPVENLTHYQWGVKYGGIDGFLILPPQLPNCGGGSLAFPVAVNIDSLRLSYDYAFEKNLTSLKTTFHLGNLTSSLPLLNPRLQALLSSTSLSLLYTTAILSPKQFGILAGGQLFNSSQTSNPSTPIDSARVGVGNVTAFDFLFGDTYTLNKTPPESYNATYTAVSKNAVSPNFFCGGVTSNAALWSMQGFLKQLLPDIGQPLANPNLNYTSSSLIYRIGYPTWSGYSLDHDPKYVAYLVGAPAFPPPNGGGNPFSGAVFPTELVALAAFTGVVALVVAARKFPRGGIGIPVLLGRFLGRVAMRGRR